MSRLKRASLLAAVVVAGIATTSLWIRRAQVLDAARAEAVRFVSTVAAAVASDLGPRREDVGFLANIPNLRTALDAPDRRAEAQAVLEVFVAAHPNVLQARLLDGSGHELVRVNREHGVIEPARDLQDKSDRYYVTAGLQLAPGEVYVSRLDLNVEHGVVESPRRPVVRIVAGVFGDDTRRGLVVVNLDAAPLLQGFERWARESPGTLMMVADDGGYLAHVDPTRAFGGTGSRPLTLADDDPQLAHWAKNVTEPSIRAFGGRFAAVAPTPMIAGAPKIVLSLTEAVALESRARDLVGVMLGIVVLGAVVAGGLFVWWRRNQLIEERERAVEAGRSAALTEAAGSLAHEVRNPLAAIVNSSALLQSVMDDPDDAKLLQIVQSESARLERVLDDFLELARPRARRHVQVDLARLVHEVVVLARRDPRFGDEVELDELAEGAPSVLGDADQLRQVLWNLILNAGEACRRAGGHRVQVRAAEGRHGDAPAAIVEIEDDGPGVDEPDAPLPKRGGLGLIVASGIVARHHGKLELRPRPGPERGAIARIAIPVQSEPG